MIIEERRLVVKVAENDKMSADGNPASGWSSRKLDKNYIETTLLSISISSSMLKPAKEAKKGIYCQFLALENIENAEEEKASL